MAKKWKDIPRKSNTPAPTKLDLGCGPRKQPGFWGVDSIEFVGVDQVVDLTGPWPWADDSIEEVFSSHFFEHLTNDQRVHAINELYRVLKVKGKATIIVPDWSNACAYGDPTHQWPPFSGWAALYWDKNWRMANAPHTGYTCDFEYMVATAFDERIMGYADERKQYMLAHNLNSARDLHFHLVKR